MYKQFLVLARAKLVVCLRASDFPKENPRPKTRNFPYTNTLPVMRKSRYQTFLCILATNRSFKNP